VSVDSEFAKDGVPTGTSLFRAPEVHLEIPWGTAADIWSFGVTVRVPLSHSICYGRTNISTAHKPNMGSQLPYIRAGRARRPRNVQH